MNISRKIVLTGVVTLGVFALGSAGAAVAHTLTVEDRAGAVQNIAPVTTGTIIPSPSESPFDDRSDDATGTTTVAPAPPINVDDDGEVSDINTDDGAADDVGSHHSESAGNPAESGDSGTESSGSASTSDDGGADNNGPSSGSGDGSGNSGGND